MTPSQLICPKVGFRPAKRARGGDRAEAMYTKIFDLQLQGGDDRLCVGDLRGRTLGRGGRLEGLRLRLVSLRPSQIGLRLSDALAGRPIFAAT